MDCHTHARTYLDTSANLDSGTHLDPRANCYSHMPRRYRRATLAQ